jgi:hypothetical protein
VADTLGEQLATPLLQRSALPPPALTALLLSPGSGFTECNGFDGLGERRHTLGGWKQLREKKGRI